MNGEFWTEILLKDGIFALICFMLINNIGKRLDKIIELLGKSER